jgi:hypothetical protein
LDPSAALQMACVATIEKSRSAYQLPETPWINDLDGCLRGNIQQVPVTGHHNIDFGIDR